MKPLQVQIYSSAISKWLLGTLCAIFVIAVAMLIILGIGWIDNTVSEPGCDISSGPWYDIRIEVLFILLIIASIAFFAILLFNYVLVRNTSKQVVASPLQGEAVHHEKQIIKLLKSAARPLPGKNTFNTAAVCQFMHALYELGYIDANQDAKYWKPWVENVTDYPGDTTGHVNAAYRKIQDRDPLVRNYIDQIQSVIKK